MLIHNELTERLLKEDVPYGDVTTEELGISDIPGVMEFRARYGCTAAGVSESEKILKSLGADVQVHRKSGAELSAGDLIMTARADAGALHMGWKVAQNIMEHATAIATRTSEMVRAGRRINPNLVVACTRKSFPGGKTICLNAVKAGGGTPHRLGTSETFLLFSNHASFFSSEDALFSALEKAAVQQPEKKLTVECDTLEYALRAAGAGAGIIQFDKVKPDKLREWIPALRAGYPHLVLEAAGGVNTETVAEYAGTGIDVAVTSYVYTGKPMDIEVTIRPI